MTSNLVWLLMLVLRDILTAVQIPPQGYRYASYEVIIPRRQTLSYGQQDPQELTYLLKIEGESHMVQLRQKKYLVPKHFPVFTYNKEGNILVDYPFIRDDCFYDGLIHGRPLALVALSTCSQGLSGLLRVENKTYEIKPIQTSSTFQHVVYRLEEEEEAVHLRCGLTVEKQHHQMAMIRNLENVAKTSSRGSWWTHTRYAKVAVVVEHERYVQFGRNETVVAMQLLDIIHMTNSFYAPLGVHVSLVGMELWSEKNLIPIAGKLDTVLHDFNLWRQNVLAPRLEHDASHLFIYKKFGTDLGLAYVAGMCSPEYASAVESYVTSTLISFAIIFTHELGHNLGMRHDEGHCICELPNCIMAKLHTLSHKFSSCSYNDYYTEIIRGRKECMKIRPDPNKLYMPKFCGNGVLEDGEECDCGSKVECKSDPCCQSGCKLRSGVICAFGECCSRCQYLPLGTVCRKSASICDLPEYCNGTSAWCPEDVYVQDGAPCQDGAYCYHGNCSTHEEQCKMIFGSKATVASEACFRELNTRGDRFGNCGITKGSDFKECKVQDIFCGRIQCENINYLPSVEEHNSIIQTRINNRLCWGTDYHNGMRIADIGAIRDGTPCGNGMICINRECTSVSFLKYDCNITKCHNRGTCNSQKHCHCNYGSAPPYCISKGYGGSIDSGPPPPHKAISARTIEGIVILLCAAVCIGLCLYSKSRLMPWYRRLSGRLYPMA